MPIDNKVAAAGIAGAVTIVLVWILNSAAHVDVPPEVASAITAILSFAAGWLTRRTPPVVTPLVIPPTTTPPTPTP